jgi:spermidine/putrescine transport system permease protein
MKKGSAAKIYTIFYLIFLYAPILLLPLFAFNSSEIIRFPLTGFTTQWFSDLFSRPGFVDATMASLKIAVGTSIIATTLGVFAARAGTRYRFRGKGAALGFIMLPLVLPEIVLGAALLSVILSLGFELSLITILFGHVLVCTPFAIAILNSAFQALDPALEEAAYDLGEGPWSAFRLVILPLVVPGIISSMLITFIISLDEFIIAFFLNGTQPTLPVYLWSLMTRKSSDMPIVMALGTILVLLSVALLVLAEYFRRRGIAKMGGKDSGGFL